MQGFFSQGQSKLSIIMRCQGSFDLNLQSDSQFLSSPNPRRQKKLRINYCKLQNSNLKSIQICYKPDAKCLRHTQFKKALFFQSVCEYFQEYKELSPLGMTKACRPRETHWASMFISDGQVTFCHGKVIVIYSLYFYVTMQLKRFGRPARLLQAQQT